MASIRILLVEDDEASAAKVKAALSGTSVPFEVHRAPTLTDALKTLSTRAFNLILLDLTLPDMQGLETLDAIRAANSQLPIVVTIGPECEVLNEEVLSRGAQQVLQKAQMDNRSLMEAMRHAVHTHIRTALSRRKVVDVRRMLSEVEESLAVCKRALAILDQYQRRDPAERDAVEALRSHLTRIQERAIQFRRQSP